MDEILNDRDKEEAKEKREQLRTLFESDKNEFCKYALAELYSDLIFVCDREELNLLVAIIEKIEALQRKGNVPKFSELVIEDAKFFKGVKRSGKKKER